MVKKKKNRHQQEPGAQNEGDSTDSGAENPASKIGSTSCPHIAKGIDFNRMKRGMRQAGLVCTCADCEKSSKLPTADEKEAILGLWLCLKCGNQACATHALQHYETPHSDVHSLVANTELWIVRCYDCEEEVSSTCKKKLQECVEYLKRQEPAKKNEQRNVLQEKEVLIVNKTPTEILSPASLTTVGHATASSPPKKIINLPQVRGLRNLGNTCFFNAVLQCLAQTPFLLQVLQEMSEAGEKFRLPGGVNHLGEEADDISPLEGELPRWGQLTEALASTLTELQSSNTEVYNPQRLLQKLTLRCPQFGGGDQQDSHELMRHLLEAVRSEDLKRYQTVILQQLGLSSKVDPTEVEGDVRVRVKAYGRQASELMLRPEHVFRGFLVSTLECQDCGHSSSCVESFLDLSLPVMADKPQPPVHKRKVSNDDAAFDVCGNTVQSNQPSKHQLKKERKQAKKARKKQRCFAGDRGEGDSSIPEGTQADKPSSGSDQSDADVEDNVDQDPGPKDRSPDVGESGYSSEKMGNEDSTVESPVSNGGNGDSMLASPANEEVITCSPSDTVEGGVWPGTALCSGPLPCLPNGGESLPEADDLGQESELLVTIPDCAEDVPMLIGDLTMGCPLSPVSTRDTPSPASSEVNIDCMSPNSTVAQRGCSSPVSVECPEDSDRPVSRFGYCNVDSRTSMSLASELPSSGNMEELLASFSKLLVLGQKDGCSSDIGLEEDGEQLNNSGLCFPADKPSISESDLNSCRPTGRQRACMALLPFMPEIDPFSCNLLQNSVDNSPDDEQSFEGVVNSDRIPCLPVINVEDASPAVESSERCSGSELVNELNKPLISEDEGQGADTSKSITVAPRYHCEEGECSVQSCLNQFTALELMAGNNKVGCENCTRRHNQGKEDKMVCTNSTKQLLVSSPPPILILHLKRFQVLRSVFRKVTRSVSFPLILDLAPICSTKCKDFPTVSSNQTQILYSLYGVVEHSGTLHGGHYVAYVKVRPQLSADDPRWRFLPSHPSNPTRNEEHQTAATVTPPPGQWYFVSDSKVYEVDEDRVLHSQAYLLFYERIW